MKASLRDGVGKLPPSHALPGCVGRVLLCPGESSSFFAHSAWGWNGPLSVTWLGISPGAMHLGQRFVPILRPGPEERRNPSLHPDDFVGTAPAPG